MDEKAFLTLSEKLSTLEKENEFLRKKCQHQSEAYQHLLQAFKDFQRHRYGARCEKFMDAASLQVELFVPQQSPEPLLTEEATNNVIDIKSHQRRKKVHKRLSAAFPHREVIIPAENKQCACGNVKMVIRYEITELLHYQPPVYEVIVQKREVIACNRECPQSIAIAPNPKRILPKVKITAQLLAHIIVSKLHDRQPHYHFEKRLIETLGLQCRRNKLSRWFIEAALALQPLVNLLKEKILEYDVAFCDPTYLQVLREPNRPPTTRSYVFCIHGGPPEQKAVIYDYNAENHKAFLRDWLTGFKGYLHVDAQNIYDDMEAAGYIKLVYCHSHVRRKFEAIAKQVTKSEGLSHHAMRFYQKIYRLEREAKRLPLSSDAKKQFRLEHMQPLLTDFKKWLDDEYCFLLPESPIGKAFYYPLNHWDGLIRFFEDPRLDIDNNSTEQLIKYVVMARKAFLFATSVNGAKALCVHMSLIRTAILHNLDPYQYYVAILEKSPYCQSIEDFETLLPWNSDVPKIKLLNVA